MVPLFGRRAWRRVALGVLALAVAVPSVAALPAAQAQTPPPVPKRVEALSLWEKGGPAVRRAAELALAGSDADVEAFFVVHLPKAKEADTRAKAEEYVVGGGPGVRQAAKQALTGTLADVEAFLATGWQRPWYHDLTVRVTQALATGGPGVRDAAARALSSGDEEDLLDFLYGEQEVQQRHDDSVRVSQALATGGPAVRAAAARALSSGSAEDIAEFLQYGWEVAAARDQEVATVSQLTAQAVAASEQARAQTRIAGEAAKNAVESAGLAKAAAERARQEAQAAEGDAMRAANAAGRAADAANRAAATAQVAIEAAAAANQAARHAAWAAGQASHAAVMAGQRASQARSAAASAAGNAANAQGARDAAVQAREAGKAAEETAKAVDAMLNALDEAVRAAVSAKGAAIDAKSAAAAADNADYWAGRAGAASGEASRSAAFATRKADEAARAADATVVIAREAAAAATESREAARSAATHAYAAADAADDAANHARDANAAAALAAAAAAAAEQAAVQAETAAAQARRVAELARKVDAERLARRSTELQHGAIDASLVESLAEQEAAWQAGEEATQLAETEQLLAAARAPGASPELIVANGRKVAARSLRRGGPWTVAAAKVALGWGDDAIRSFVDHDLEVAQERDDRESVTAIARTTNNLAMRDAAVSALAGDANAVRNFLRTRMYATRDHDYKARVSEMLSEPGAGLRTAAAQALNQNLATGSMDPIIEFLSTGQYEARAQDNRVAVTALTTSAVEGPEVRDSARVMLSAPRGWLPQFLQVDVHKARQRDREAAAHERTVNAMLARADQAAASARVSSAEAARLAAVARGAAAEADHWANVAGMHASAAFGHANQAQESADQAQESANAAAASADTARDAEARARRDAFSATRFANHAQVSAQRATAFASEAHREADKAHVSAAAAHASAEEANAAAAEATLIAWDKHQQRELARIRQDIDKGDAVVLVEKELMQQCAVAAYMEGVEQELARMLGLNSSVPVCSSIPEHAYQEALRRKIDGVTPEHLLKGFMIFVENAYRASGQARPYLEIFGNVPFLGEFVDGGLCIWDISADIADVGPEKELTDIGVSCAAIIPFAGSGASATRPVMRFSDEGEKYLDELAGLRRAACSFSADTPVIMADGRRKAIADVRVGDRVLAAEPDNGASGARAVVAAVPHLDQLLSLVTSAGVIVTTHDHRYWNQTDREWQESQHLDRGDQLLTDDGDVVTVEGLDESTVHSAVAYDLTVEDLHTFFVGVGSAAVLVHNCGELNFVGSHLDDATQDQINTLVDIFDANGGRLPDFIQRGGGPHHIFKNFEGRLPSKPEGYYRESDVWALQPNAAGTGGVRGSERLVFGNGGEVYYTGDHYQTFIRLR